MSNFNSVLIMAINNLKKFSTFLKSNDTFIIGFMLKGFMRNKTLSTLMESHFLSAAGKRPYNCIFRENSSASKLKDNLDDETVVRNLTNMTVTLSLSTSNDSGGKGFETHLRHNLNQFKKDDK